MTGRRRPGVGEPAASSGIVSIGVRGNYRPDYKRLASGQVAAARAALNLNHAGFAAYLGDLLGWTATSATVERWERGSTPPGDVVSACSVIAQGTLAPAPPLLAAVPPGFAAETLAGSWVTSYQFSHGGTPHHHADIAHVTAESGSRIRAVNHPPEPRSEGRRRPFRNEIEATLAGRHLIGEWQNTSDTRYCGSLQMAVLPGEIVMQGYYTGVGSDIEVSTAPWKWVRLDPDSIADLAAVRLRKPQDLYELVMAHNQYGEPLTLADVTEEH